MEIDARIEAVSNLGHVTILFDPPVVMVPNDWDRLWSSEELDKLSLKDREEY